MVGRRQPDVPVLPLAGRRSIATCWPEGAFCDRCGTLGDSGFVGPVTGDRAFFPDQRLVFVCRPCALTMVGVDEAGFAVHRCIAGCTDRLHVEVTTADEAVRAGPEAADRAAAAAWRTAGTPWLVVDVTPVSRSLAAALGWLADHHDTSDQMAVWMELAVPLSWEEPETSGTAGRGGRLRRGR
jgi:hypothetical protein